MVRESGSQEGSSCDVRGGRHVNNAACSLASTLTHPLSLSCLSLIISSRFTHRYWKSVSLLPMQLWRKAECGWRPNINPRTPIFSYLWTLANWQDYLINRLNWSLTSRCSCFDIKAWTTASRHKIIFASDISGMNILFSSKWLICHQDEGYEPCATVTFIFEMSLNDYLKSVKTLVKSADQSHYQIPWLIIKIRIVCLGVSWASVNFCSS